MQPATTDPPPAGRLQQKAGMGCFACFAPSRKQRGSSREKLQHVLQGLATS
jgi:hypothetical protein